MERMKIGFIGLGIMGSRMAANLQKHGYALVLFNRTRAKAEPLLGPCGKFAGSPAEVAEQVDFLFTMLPQPDAVEQAALGSNGFLDHLRPNAIWVDCSSVNPSFSKNMAAEAASRGVHFVDAPATPVQSSDRRVEAFRQRCRSDRQSFHSRHGSKQQLQPLDEQLLVSERCGKSEA